jgi:hypothetical protein
MSAGSTARSPTSIIHATTEGEPMSFVDRDEQRVDAPKQKAAPIPPRIASNPQPPSPSTN